MPLWWLAVVYLARNSELGTPGLYTTQPAPDPSFVRLLRAASTLRPSSFLVLILPVERPSLATCLRTRTARGVLNLAKNLRGSARAGSIPWPAGLLHLRLALPSPRE